MNVKKILKFYLIFTLSVTAVTSVGYIDSVKNYVPDFLYTSGEEKYFKNSSFASTLHSINFQDSGSKYFSEKSFDSGFNFEVLSDPKKSFAKPGAKDAWIMEYKLKTNDFPLVLGKLRLKIVGLSPEKIEKIYLVGADQKILKQTSVKSEYVEFNNIGLSLEKNSEASLFFHVDLVSDIKTGERLRLDIENPEDVDVKIGNTNSSINSYYPIKGKSLSIVQPRPLSNPKLPEDDVSQQPEDSSSRNKQ